VSSRGGASRIVVSRADTWFVVSALRAGARWAGSQHAPTVAAAEPSASLSSWSPPSRLRAADSSRSYSEATPSFESRDVRPAGRRAPSAVCLHAAVSQHAEFSPSRSWSRGWDGG
jgi:hypothetical protein